MASSDFDLVLIVLTFSKGKNSNSALFDFCLSYLLLFVIFCLRLRYCLQELRTRYILLLQIKVIS